MNYLIVDDLGWKDVGFMGSNYYETPYLDQLASEGMMFTQAYAGAANCAPSRACLLSGQNSPRYGIYTVGNTPSQTGFYYITTVDRLGSRHTVKLIVD